ncbi:MAG: type I-E CRISPR-associated protein Cas7/Cse4/CasC [Saccharofermentanales bacterium]|mgnify:CR=1 FL=1|nr:type I-E CRISPR-associated protein Cas7/Cse4/CasC [Clostridiaceae bacterium]
MTNNNHLFLDIHVIQTIPPSNVNRDDTGSPKTAQYGGARRARVSSQAWKKAMRDYFNENGAQSNVGVRTLNVVQYVANKILKLDPRISEADAFQQAEKVINAAGITTKDGRARALFFIGNVQAKALAKAALDGVEDKKILQAILNDNPAVDIALFGRMVADDPSLNEDASAQVAHAISTHAVQTEFDFFTAIDDLSPEDNAGAGMLGTIEFNSSAMYRYANVAVHELYRQLDDKEQTLNTLKLFIEAFANSMPTGKSNTFANQTLPQAIVVTVRNDRPVNLVSAFEEPVKSSEGYVAKSIEKLFEEFKNVEKFVRRPEFTLYVTGYDVDNCDVGEAESDLRVLLNKFYDAMDGLVPEKAE